MAFVLDDVASENPVIRFAVSAAFSPLHQCLSNTRMERYGFFRAFRLAHSDYAINNRARHARGPSCEVDVAPLQSKQFTLSQAGRRSEKHKRPFSKTKDVYQGLDFSGRKRARRLPPFGTLTDELDGVVVVEFVPASMVEENRHQISEFSAGTSCQRKMPKPGLDFDRSNVRKTALSPIGQDPSLQVALVGLLGCVASPGVVASQFTLLKMITELGDGQGITSRDSLLRIDFRNQDLHRTAGSRLIRVLLNRADDSPAIDAFGVGTFLGPTKLPNLRALLAFVFYQASSLHSDLLRRPAAQQKCSPRNGNLREREFLGNQSRAQVTCLSAAVVCDALVRGEASTNIGDKRPGAVTIGSE